MKATGSEALIQLVCYEVRSLYINQTNEVGNDKVGGTINDILYLKSYGFGQVIFVVWIKFFSLEKHFSSVIVMWL